MNPRGALYAFMNCPCSTVCPRGVVHFFLFTCVCSTSSCELVGVFEVPRVSIGFSVPLILPSVENSAHSFTGFVGWIYSLITF